MERTLAILNGGLVVSCQPLPGSPMDEPSIVAAMALASLSGGASGLRIEGEQNLRAVRAATTVPIIGLIKRELEDSPVRITPGADDVRLLISAGADIIAYDATSRRRPVPTADVVAAVRAAGKIPMADCASLADAQQALAEGAHIVGSTLSGYAYSEAPAGAPPDLGLVRDMARLDGFVMAEGRIGSPEDARAAMDAGANCVTVGTALTRLELMTRRFTDAIAGQDRA